MGVEVEAAQVNPALTQDKRGEEVIMRSRGEEGEEVCRDQTDQKLSTQVAKPRSAKVRFSSTSSSPTMFHICTNGRPVLLS